MEDKEGEMESLVHLSPVRVIQSWHGPSQECLRECWLLFHKRSFCRMEECLACSQRLRNSVSITGCREERQWCKIGSVQAVVSRWEQQLLSIDFIFFLVNFQKVKIKNLIVTLNWTSVTVGFRLRLFSCSECLDFFSQLSFPSLLKKNVARTFSALEYDLGRKLKLTCPFQSGALVSEEEGGGEGEMNFWCQAWIWVSVLPFTSFITLDNWLNSPAFHFSLGKEIYFS